MGERIMVTGGAGFIGSHLCERLLNEGNEVLCVDNLFTGARGNMHALMDNKNFEFMRYNIADGYVPADGIDKIYNLACPASPKHYQFDAIQTIETNVVGTSNILKVASRTKARVLQASTSEIYGDPTVHPQTEEYWGNVNTLGPRACYDEGKRCAETLLASYHHQVGVDIRIVRIFNTYGPNMNPEDGRVVSNFIMQALKNEDITLYGDGSQTRSFQYIDDLVEGMIRMMNNEEGFVGPVNLGNPNEFTIRQLAEKVIEMVPGTKSKIIEAQPLPQDDPKQRQPDITLAKEKLDWEPTIQLEEGLKKTIAYFKGLDRIAT